MHSPHRGSHPPVLPDKPMLLGVLRMLQSLKMVQLDACQIIPTLLACQLPVDVRLARPRVKETSIQIDDCHAIARRRTPSFKECCENLALCSVLL